MTKFTWHRERLSTLREFEADYMNSDKDQVVLSTTLINGLSAKASVIIKLEPGDYVTKGNQ